MSVNLMYIPVDLVYPNPRNPRKNFDETAMAELVASVRQVGILQPVVVVPDEDESLTRYRLVAGERRWRAAQDAGIKEIPAVVRELTEQEELEVMIIENLQRRDIDPVEEARGFRTLLDTADYTQEALAEKLGCSQSHIANRLRLLELPESVQQNISRGIIGPGHAKELLSAKDKPEIVEKVAKKVAEKGLTVKDIAQEVKREIWESSRALTDEGYPTPDFDTECCQKCKKKTMLKHPYQDTEKLRCLAPECWDVKQKEAQQMASEEREKELQAKFPDAVMLDDLQENSFYRLLRGHLIDSSFCSTKGCPHFKQGRLHLRQWTEDVCLNPDEFEKCLKEYEQQREAKQQEEVASQHAQRTEISELINRQLTGGVNRNVLIFIAGVIIGSAEYISVLDIVEYLEGIFDELLELDEDEFLGAEWQVLHSKLNSLSDEQLLKIIIEVPVVALGIREGGIIDWFLKLKPEPVTEANEQVEAGEEFESERIGWILRNSVNDVNYKANIPKLTDEELRYCLQNEKRKSGLQQLQREAQKRGIDGLEPESVPVQEPGPELQQEHEQELQYFDNKGRILFVSGGSGQDQYGTFWRSDSGGLHRVKSPAMPMVSERQLAEENLKAWAKKKKLKPVEDSGQDAEVVAS